MSTYSELAAGLVTILSGGSIASLIVVGLIRHAASACRARRTGYSWKQP